ncbi:MAG: ADOP family duplicated permease [Candidatus Acidiferrales bacterium]
MNFRQIAQRALAFFRKESWDRDFDAEAASHLDFAIEENIRSGMAPEEARRQALIRFGGIQQSKEKHRQARGLPFLDSVLQDLRYTFRTLRRDRGFALIAVLMLGLGIGANVAVFSVVDGILLRPLPLHNPERLVWIEQAKDTSGLSSLTYAADAYEEFRNRNRSFQSVTGYFAFTQPDNFRLTGYGQPLPVTAIYVVGNFFRTLGVQPKIGRLFTSGELQKNGPPAVLLSYPFWKRQFAGNSNIVGRTIDLNDKPVTVAGVLPESFDFGSIFLPGETVDMFVPYILDDWRNDGNDLPLIGRLKPGVTLPQAQAEANLIAPDLYIVKYPASKGYYTMKLTSLKQYVSGKLRRSLIVLWSAVGLILLIVCVNLSNLLLARAAARTKEFAMRLALGAGRGRLIRQLLTESLVLAAAGAALGLCIAYAITSYLAHQGSLALPLLSGVRVDGTALAWTILVTAAAAVLFGLLPGLKMSGKNVQASLKDMGHGMSTGRRHQRLRSVLVVSEIALACVLLIGAGLLLHSFLRLLDVHLGFQPDHAAVINVDFQGSGNPQKRTVSLHEILRRVQGMPGIESAGISDNLPLEGNRSWGLGAKGKQYRKGEMPDAFVYVITPGYFDAMGMRLLKGRQFDWHDGVHSQPVVILNEKAARTLWPGKDAVGRVAVVGGTNRTVIGVLADVHQSSLEAGAGLQMYLPVSQAWPERAELVVRSKLPVSALAPSIMHTLRSINPQQPSTQLRPIETDVNHAVSPRRFFVSLVSAFAAFGLLLAALGIFGVISYSVTQRTQEIGIRMALGATAGRIQANVLSQTVRLAVIGVVSGAIVSLAVARLIASLLFKTAPTDPIAFAGTVVLLGLTALLAGWIPARRASRVDPMSALRAN